jgi:hypothetical protein
MKKAITTLFIFFSCYFSFSQSFNDNYAPIRDYRPDKEFLKSVSSDFDSTRIAQIYPGRGQKKEVKSAFRESKKELLSLDTAKLLMRNDTITKYLQSLVNKIQQKNPLLNKRNFTVFTYRTDEPNAANWGAGVILVNLDLVSKYTHEEEMISTLCHEISHDLKEHVVNSLEESYAITHSEEFKKEWKKMKHSQYNQFKQYEALVTKFLKKDSKSSRVKELEADSLGLVLFYNAGYHAFYAFQEMEKLDSVDNPAYNNKIDYFKVFNFPSYPFKNSWLEEEAEEETIGGGNVSTKWPDSLKTHPDCKNRLTALKRIAKRQNYNPAKPTGINSTYNYYRVKAFFEILEYNMLEYNSGEALYDALELIGMYPNNTYVKCSIVNCLYQIYNGKATHYTSFMIDMPDKKLAKNYNQLLVFLQNVNSDIIKEIMVNYYKANVEGKINDNYSGYIDALISSIYMEQKEREKLIDLYKKKYNDSYYISLLNRKFKPKKK